MNFRGALSRNAKMVSLLLAISTTVALGVLLPLIVEPFNDARFSTVTILDEPPLLDALRDAQKRGVLMCIHGFRHENFMTLSPDEAKDAIEKSMRIFDEAGLVPAAFIAPYGDYSMLLQSLKSAIKSTGIATSLPVPSSNIKSLGWQWRDMNSYRDPRFTNARQELMKQQPGYILIHAQDWNPFLKQLLTDYLQNTEQTNVTVRVDDIEVNTPPEYIYDIAGLLKYNSTGLMAFSIIPSGTWRGGDPAVFGISVDSIFHFYWVFFLSTTFFPFCFFLTWRITTKFNPKNNPGDDSIYPDPIENVSIIVPAFNEEENIGRCIEAILNQDFKGEKEIIIMNDGSTDRTAEEASKYPVRLINLPANVGKANALNIGINNASGEVLVFSDSDSRMSRKAVSSLIRCLEKHPDVGAVAGNVLISEPEGKNNLLTYFQMIEYRNEQEINRYLQSLDGKVLVCPGPLFAVRGQIARNIMFSDKSVIEDADFTVEVLKNSIKVVREPEARVYTEAPSSLGKWINQRKRWWYGNLQIWKIHRDWATENSWMILNYLGYIIGTFSLALLILLPFLYLMFDNIFLVLLRGVTYTFTPIILFFLLLIPLYFRNKKLFKMLLPYIMIYSTLKVLMVSYIYVSYISRRGIKITFGPRIIEVK